MRRSTLFHASGLVARASATNPTSARASLDLKSSSSPPLALQRSSSSSSNSEAEGALLLCVATRTWEPLYASRRNLSATGRTTPRSDVGHRGRRTSAPSAARRRRETARRPNAVVRPVPTSSRNRPIKIRESPRLTAGLTRGQRRPKYPAMNKMMTTRPTSQMILFTRLLLCALKI